MDKPMAKRDWKRECKELEAENAALKLELDAMQHQAVERTSELIALREQLDATREAYHAMAACWNGGAVEAQLAPAQNEVAEQAKQIEQLAAEREKVTELEAAQASDLETLKHQGESLEIAYQQLAAAQATIAEIAGCFEAAYAEGLTEAIVETQDERVKDLFVRRLEHAYIATQATNQDALHEARARECKRLVEFADINGDHETAAWLEHEAAIHRARKAHA